MARGLLCVIQRLEGFNTMEHQHGISWALSCLVRQEVVLELQELREQVKQIKEVPIGGKLDVFLIEFGNYS